MSINLKHLIKSSDPEEIYNFVASANFALKLIKAGKEDMILVCGSVFVVGELSVEAVRSVWGKEESKGSIFDALEIAAWSFFR